MTPRKRFSHQSFQIFQRDALVLVSQVITGAILARYLGPAAMGLWLVLLLLPSYAEAIGRPQADTASVYVLSKGMYRIGEVAFALVCISCAGAAALVAAFLGLQDWFFSSYLAGVAESRHYAYLMLAHIPVIFTVRSYMYLLLSQEDVSGYNIAAVVVNVVPLLLGAILVLTTNLGVMALVLGLLGGGYAALIYSLIRVHRSEPMIIRFRLLLFKDLLSTGWKLYLGNLASYLHVYICGLLIVLYVSLEEVAFFRMGQDRALMLLKVSAAVGTLLYPRIAHLAGNPDEAKALTATSFRLTLLVLIAAAALGAALAKPGVWLLYGPAFSGVVLPLLILLPGVVAEASTGLLTQYFMGRGRLWVLVGISVLALAAQLALLWFTLPRWGILGGAVAVSAAFLMAAALRVAVFSRLEQVPLQNLLAPRGKDLRFLWEFTRQRLHLQRRPVVPV